MSLKTRTLALNIHQLLFQTFQHNGMQSTQASSWQVSQKLKYSWLDSQRLGQGAKKIIFIYSLPFREADQLAFTSPDVTSTSCKNFLTSRTDFTVIPRYLNSSKKHQLPIAHWASEKQNSLAQQQNPLAPGYWTLLSLHAGGPYLIEHFLFINRQK